MIQPDFSKLIYDPASGAFYRTKAPNIQLFAVGNHGYVNFKVGKQKFLAHRIAWYMTYGKWPAGEIDHINGVKTDNRIINLRDVQRQTNIHNQSRPQKGNRSGYLGVMWAVQRKTWFARIAVNGKRKHLGTFKTPEAAHAAYLAAKQLLHPTAPVR